MAQVDGNLYGVFDFNKRQDLTPFACGTPESDLDVILNETKRNGRRSQNGECVEVAIDIDNFTLNTFGNISSMQRIGPWHKWQGLRPFTPKN